MKTVLNYNEVVEYKGNNYVVVGKNWHQSRHYRPDAYMICYSLCPIEYEGMEHDEEIRVGESDYLAYKNLAR
jgi:hypothetical protein